VSKAYPWIAAQAKQIGADFDDDARNRFPMSPQWSPDYPYVRICVPVSQRPALNVCWALLPTFVCHRPAPPRHATPRCSRRNARHALLQTPWGLSSPLCKARAVSDKAPAELAKTFGMLRKTDYMIHLNPGAASTDATAPQYYKAFVRDGKILLPYISHTSH